jgi:hypothetical protein
LLDHLGVVIGGQSRFRFAAFRHWQPADEVAQPRVRGRLDLGVLVQEVVEIPRLVPDPQVVALGGDDVVEHHEVREQNLVHPPEGVEYVQFVLARLGLHVSRLSGQLDAGGMDALTASLEDRCHGVLGEPLDLEVRT